MPLNADAGSQRSLRHNVQPTRLLICIKFTEPDAMLYWAL
jgi:hypothetical protein